MGNNQKGLSLDVSAVRVFSALFIINAVRSISIWVALEQPPRICSPLAITNHPPCYIICRSCIDGSCGWQGENTASFSESLLAAAALWKSVRPDIPSAVNGYNSTEDNRGVVTLWEHGSSSDDCTWWMSILQLLWESNQHFQWNFLTMDKT